MIYFDSSAGNQCYPEVILTITDVLMNHWGNPHSDTSFGYDAETIINSVTEQVAKDINCKPEEIIWTSSGSESNSLAVLGFVQANPKKAVLISSNLEHASINHVVERCSENFYGYIKNDEQGFVDLQSLEDALRTVWGFIPIVSISAANSEIGTIQNIKAIADIVHKYNGVLHIDAVQLYPWQCIDVQALGIDMMSVSGQKLHCPRGIGFLYVKEGIDLAPLICGSQQNGLRGGTLPTHLIAAFGKALEITRKKHDAGDVQIKANWIRDQLSRIEGVTFNGPIAQRLRLPNNISITIDGVSSDQVVAMCDEQGIMVAKGSACQSYNPVPSKTLLAIGLTEEQALSTVRITLDEFNTWGEAKKFCEIFPKIVERIRTL